MATRIKFDPKLSHVLGFRHGPRAARPPAGNVWDYHQMLSTKAPEIARLTKAVFFPDIVPVELRCSQIPRSAQTLGLLWPELIPQIKLDRRLGIEFEDIPLWSAIDGYPNAYDMTPQDQHSLCPYLVDKCGRNFLEAARVLAGFVGHVGLGHVGVMCSHMPIADCGARFARLALGITENDGWLPGTGFGSGAFVHLGFVQHYCESFFDLVSCEYYPAIEPELEILKSSMNPSGWNG